ncbi:hypothetical protein Q3G72_018355 [Acer saccharum]|nr:hypothetical protein Q3G72_018355 [Acer saccharum]
MNAEEIEMLCGALSIKEKEGTVGTLDEDLKSKGEQRLSLCLVGKVMATKLVNRDAFMDVMQSIWRVNEGVKIEPVEGNVFLFHFRNMEDRKCIQTGGHWSFDRAMIVFEEPTDWRGKTRGRPKTATGIQMRGEECSEIQRSGMGRYVPPKTCMGNNTSINGFNGAARKETSRSNVSGEVIMAKSNDKHLEDIVVDEAATMGGI